MPELSLEELAAEVGVPKRTVRFYITLGLLPGPGARGKGAAYGEGQLARLRLIKLLRERMSLADVKRRLEGLSDADVAELLAEEERQGRRLQVELAEAEQRSSPRDYVAALLADARAARSAVREAAPRYLPTPRGPLTEGERWQRIELAPGVELHVREDVEETERRALAVLVRRARQLLGGGR